MAQVSRQQEQTDRAAGLRTVCHAPVTLFALPKPFTGQAQRIQANAISSWLRLRPAVDVLLLGGEEGIEEFAEQSGAFYGGNVRRNEHGTPLVSSAFEIAHQVSTSPILVYCNADVILDRGFVRALEQLSEHFLDNGNDFLAIGQRTDLKVEQLVDFANAHDVEALKDHCKQSGQLSSAVCKEYFAFRRTQYRSIPPFAVGRGNWDNWMVAHAHRSNFQVIDLTPAVLAIHQSHDYTHALSSRMACYVNGDEARENQRLAGGRNLLSGSTCSHELRDGMVKPIGLLKRTCRTIGDIPRFSKLLVQLLVQK